MHDFGADECAVSAISLPFTSEVGEARAGTSYIAVEVRRCNAILAARMADMSILSTTDAPAFSSIDAASGRVDAVCR